MHKLESSSFKYLHIIPNLITYTNMLLGVLAILLSINHNIGNIKIASILILIAGITDKLDGYVARKLNLTSAFGRELDSLCDLISFGVAPIIIWWSINGGTLGILEILISLLFIGSAIFRLARFNITVDDGHIRGLPITIAGLIMSIKYIIDINFRLLRANSNQINYENLLIIILLSLLMICSFEIKKPL